MTFWIAQAFSIVAIIVITISFQIKNKNILLSMNATANMAYGVSFLLLGAYFGAATAGIAVLRGMIFINIEKRPKWYSWSALLLIYLLLIISVIFTYENFLSIIMLLSVLVLVFSLWQKNIFLIRFASILASCVYIIYNIVHSGWINIVFESLIIISCVVFLIRVALARRTVINSMQ